MAGDWIKMRTALADDPAVIAMAEALDTDEFCVVGRLHHVWSWADAQSRDGHARGVTLRWINRYVRRDGFAEAMVNVGWLEESEDGICFPNFDRHNGESAKARGLSTNRKQKQRAAEAGEPSDSPNMSRTERDESVTREEKRREEKKEANASVDSAASASPADLLGPSTSIACPAERIVKAYHELMPENPRVKILNDARRRMIASRWREASRLECQPFGYRTVEEGVEAWRRFFSVCAESEFLTGKSKPQPGKPPFVADIDFLISPSGFAKCLENKYHREAA